MTEIEYDLSPKMCVSCSLIIPFKKRNNKFCDSSCAASHSNKGRVRTQDSKTKVSLSLKGKKCGKPAKYPKQALKDQIIGEYTKIYLCVCKFTGQKWYSPTVRTIHPSYVKSFKDYSYMCRFNFSINKYPEWFEDASFLITTYGWYSTPGSNRNGITNLNGISRDHRLSVSAGYKLSIDVSIISHPANCRLLPHTLNQMKHTKSEISLEELLNDIEKFNKLYGLNNPYFG